MVRGMYLTMSPLIAGGIANMLFVKSPLYRKCNTPMDGGCLWKDGNRVFGDNKTWIGFFSMIIFCSVFQILCGLFCQFLSLNEWNDLYRCNSNTVLFSMTFGAGIGFVYMICELPNSFLKRRISIDPGKTGNGFLGCLFFVIDQIDSLLGVMLVLFFMTDISVGKYFFYVFLGALTHVAVNLFLYLTKIRKNL